MNRPPVGTFKSRPLKVQRDAHVYIHVDALFVHSLLFERKRMYL